MIRDLLPSSSALKWKYCYVAVYNAILFLRSSFKSKLVNILQSLCVKKYQIDW
jgi:hypothetical protein